MMPPYAAQQAVPDARGNSRAGAAAARPWAFSLWPISQLHRRNHWRRCGDFRALIWSSLAGRQRLQSRTTTKQDTPKRRNHGQTRTNPRVTKRSCAEGLKGVLSISQKSCLQRIGNVTVNAFIARLPIGRNGQKQRTILPPKSRIWSQFSGGMSSAVSGLLSTKPSAPKSTGDRWFPIGMFCFGLVIEIPRLSRIGSASGGLDSRKTRQSTGCTLRAAIKRAARGISRCTPPKRHSLLLSPLGVGGATSTATNCLRLKTCKQSARLPIVKMFGGPECFAGLSGAKSASAGDAPKGFLGSSLVGLNAGLPRGFETKSRPKSFPDSGVMDR